MSGTLQQFPQRGTSFQSADGLINPVWYKYLHNIWLKTGGGSSSQTVTGLQAEIDTLSASKVAKNGDTMSGELILAGTPAHSLGAAPRSYTDAETTARAAADALLLPLTGGVLSGSLRAPYYFSTVYTVAGLPGLPTAVAGTRAFVSNALGPVFGAAVVGGGAVNIPVYSDGVIWRVG